MLGPILGSLSIPARIEMTTRLMPKMVLIMPTVVTLTLAAGWQLGAPAGRWTRGYTSHGWIVASYIVVGCMAVIALGLLEPANIAVLIELKKPRPNPAMIERLMKRFLYSAGVLGLLQVATLVIMTKVATDDRAPAAAGHAARHGVAGADRRRRHLPVGPSARARAARPGGRPARRRRRCCSPSTWSRSRGSTASPGSASSRSAGGRCWPTRSPPGLIEYAFVHNHVRGGTLVVLTLSLVVYAVHVPMLIAFTVARYADYRGLPAGGRRSCRDRGRG